ncbi:MAG: sirohydrochlorin chelatase [Aeromicrobium sp.]
MRPALIAVSHGTSSPAGQASVAGLVGAVRRRLPGIDVSEAFVDVQEPSPDVVLDSLAGPAVVVPLFMAPGFHVHVDIARSVAGRDATATDVLGTSRAITGMMLDRLRDAGLRNDDAVVLGVAGSSDARAHQSVDRVAARLAMRLGREVAVGHLGGTGRRIDDVVAEASGRRVVVATYLLAPGHFADLLHRCGADVVVTAPLLDSGPPDPRLVQLVVDRYESMAGARQQLRRAS